MKALILAVVLLVPSAALRSEPCRIEIRDADNGWPVPMVELESVDGQRFVSDNAGLIALDVPDLMNRDCFFHVHGHGYEVEADGFGFKGVRFTPVPGGKQAIKVNRKSIAKRLGRLTGGGLFAESQQLGERLDWQDGPLVGCDSVQMTLYHGKPFWNWGDTQLAYYPLGNFHMTAALTDGSPIGKPVPPIEPSFEYMLDSKGRPKGVAKMEGSGPTWLSGYATLNDAKGGEHLVATYRKITNPMITYEIGLCEWDDQQQTFRATARLWSKSDGTPEPTLVPVGHSVTYRDPGSQQLWLLMGDPLPKFRCEATYEAWRDSSHWQAIETPRTLPSIDGGEEVELHSGSITWNAYRQRWLAIFMQRFGKPSAFGELWYAESRTPEGPWSPAVKVLSHDNYTFYNPRWWGELADRDSPILLFEGTYTRQFANAPSPTPRYDYNQILYRLDLDDARLSRPQLNQP